MDFDVLAAQIDQIIESDRQKIRMLDRPGCIYVVHLWGSVYKIGKTSNMEQRIASVQNSLTAYFKWVGQDSPMASLTHAIASPCIGWAEQEVHQRYCHQRLQFEEKMDHWVLKDYLTTELFRLSDADVNELQSIIVLQPEWW